MFKRLISLCASTALLSACAVFDPNNQYSSLSDYCDQNRGICAAGFFLITAGVVGAVIAADNQSSGGSSTQSGGGGGGGGGGNASDIRLKTDIAHVKTLDNGIRLHRYRYLGDERYFVGVLAQEILEMPAYAHAVGKSGGYLTVNYAQLGLKLHRPDLLQQASRAVLHRASKL